MIERFVCEPFGERPPPSVPISSCSGAEGAKVEGLANPSLLVAMGGEAERSKTWYSCASSLSSLACMYLWTTRCNQVTNAPMRKKKPMKMNPITISKAMTTSPTPQQSSPPLGIPPQKSQPGQHPSPQSQQPTAQQSPQSPQQSSQHKIMLYWKYTSQQLQYPRSGARCLPLQAI
eukprot:CAMPEP_0115602618 /NCGR_PEP_ID=MMETSP0272-20121206/16006_1 /TAXON_ID=71861 /ORGANISM="Scrippsiella trochoidea, Strain CCMP3099" /LENGTH=174 /DNA_ID=CAMNT_0003038117 /DNA_START=192 /DNA_END=716 /DNA_ORIENTATION=+